MNIEKVLLDHLNRMQFKELVVPSGDRLIIQGESLLSVPQGTVSPVPCYGERPQKPPQAYVVLDKTGGTETNLIERSTIAFQSIAPTKAEASFLNDAVKEAIYTADTLPGVSAVSLISDGDFTNPTTKTYRYQTVFEITHKI